ncbi:hypothetical protein WSM22_30550 [Cytophagales bacterium WSM2-2]|nr:hypothetical protein WSM22_30550 [Cytophagales bacterium WSM2-2]
MTEEEQIEWARFQTLALGQLDSFVDQQNFLGLRIDPSFDKAERLFVSKAKDGLRWTYKTWDSATDYERIYSTHEERMKMKFGKQLPTIEITRGEIGEESYKRTNKIIDKLNLKSLVKSDGFGLDGTSYSISIGDSMRETKYSWWENLPKEWADLEPILQELTDNLNLARTALNYEYGKSGIK